jgi:hypothetical protein
MAILGPTFDEMLHPETIAPELRRRALEALERDPLDPINLFNITWRDPGGAIRYVVLPEALTGVAAPIVVLYARDFPTGSHKVGAAYACSASWCCAARSTRGDTRWSGPRPATTASAARGSGAAWASRAW